MYYISLKRQAKIISPNSSASSTDITNIQKKLVSKGSWLLSNYFWLLKKLVSNRSWLPSNYFWSLKKLVSGPCRALLNLYFFIIKSNKQQASSRQLRCLFIFFYLKKQQATSLSSTLDTCSRIL